MMSSFVGPRPPVTTTIWLWASARSSVSTICVRSSPIEHFSRTTMPAAFRCFEMDTELVSTICPIRISSPMVMTVACMDRDFLFGSLPGFFGRGDGGGQRAADVAHEPGTLVDEARVELDERGSGLQHLPHVFGVIRPPTPMMG